MSSDAEKRVFEQPLNERMRTFLRLEALVARLRLFAARPSSPDSRAAVAALLELQELTSRVDLKRELMKELDRQCGNLTRLARTPDVDASKLQGVLDHQKSLVNRIHGLTGQVGHHLKNNEFLGGIKQRASIAGGLCDFDAPSYHHWLSLPHAERRADLEGWLEPFDLVIEAVELTLDLVRKSVSPLRVQAENGFLHQALDAGVPYQMIRVELPADSPFFPEISGGKHRFSVRFFTLSRDEWRSLQAEEDIHFHLSCCAI